MAKGRNSYFYFMLEKKAELERKGHRFPNGMKDVAALVADEWKELPPEKRERYNQMAKGAKGQDGGNGNGNPGNGGGRSSFHNGNRKFTNTGFSYDAIERQQAMRQREQEDLQQMFLEVMGSNPEKAIIVVMHAINSCVVGLNNDVQSMQYFPLEIAAASFSLKEGVICTYWSLIDTHKVPCGYASTAKDTSEETGLPQPGAKIFQELVPEASNYNKIITKIRRFVETCCAEHPIDNFLIFAMESNFQKLQGSLEWLVKNADENTYDNHKFLKKIKLYNLSRLAIYLAVDGHRRVPAYRSELEQFRLVPSADAFLAHGVYDYNIEITCPYHRQPNFSHKMHMCCKNFILRRVFFLLAEFCPVYSCPITDQHRITSFYKHKLSSHLQSRMPEVMHLSSVTTTPYSLHNLLEEAGKPLSMKKDVCFTKEEENLDNFGNIDEVRFDEESNIDKKEVKQWWQQPKNEAEVEILEDEQDCGQQNTRGESVMDQLVALKSKGGTVIRRDSKCKPYGQYDDHEEACGSDNSNVHRNKNPGNSKNTNRYFNWNDSRDSKVFKNETYLGENKEEECDRTYKKIKVESLKEEHDDDYDTKDTKPLSKSTDKRNSYRDVKPFTDTKPMKAEFVKEEDNSSVISSKDVKFDTKVKPFMDTKPMKAEFVKEEANISVISSKDVKFDTKVKTESDEDEIETKVNVKVNYDRIKRKRSLSPCCFPKLELKVKPECVKTDV